MKRPLRAGGALREQSTPPDVGGAAKKRPPKRPKRGMGQDPSFVPTLIGRESMKSLRKLQKADRPPVNLKYLSEACHQLALEIHGGQAVRERALSLSQSGRGSRS